MFCHCHTLALEELLFDLDCGLPFFFFVLIAYLTPFPVLFHFYMRQNHCSRSNVNYIFINIRKVILVINRTIRRYEYEEILKKKVYFLRKKKSMHR